MLHSVISWLLIPKTCHVVREPKSFIWGWEVWTKGISLMKLGLSPLFGSWMDKETWPTRGICQLPKETRVSLLWVKTRESPMLPSTSDLVRSWGGVWLFGWMVGWAENPLLFGWEEQFMVGNMTRRFCWGTKWCGPRLWSRTERSSKGQ